MNRSIEAWITQYERKGALWLHDGNPRRPHALLSGGEHSNGFFNSELVMEDPVLLDTAVADLAALLTSEPQLRSGRVDRVVGPAMGAITLAHDMARHLKCLRGYTEKDVVSGPEGDRKVMVFKRVALKPNERVLLVEDVLTSGQSIELAASAVKQAGGIMLPFVGVIVNRSGRKKVGGMKIIALIDRHMPRWCAHKCELCALGSEPLKPKEKENWARLNASY
jgi:orotate phosphoribosyltransferase